MKGKVCIMKKRPHKKCKSKVGISPTQEIYFYSYLYLRIYMCIYIYLFLYTHTHTWWKVLSLTNKGIKKFLCLVICQIFQNEYLRTFQNPLYLLMRQFYNLKDINSCRKIKIYNVRIYLFDKYAMWLLAYNICLC